ncbi:MAG TPA: hypothetical protein ENK10_07480 [Acidobacteria bacterium]|nr:hypothetical protein [Acidobacteriota bacterium]
MVRTNQRRRLRARSKGGRRRQAAGRRGLEATAATLLALGAMVGTYFGIRAGSLYAATFCLLWLLGTVIWFFSIFGYREKS